MIKKYDKIAFIIMMGFFAINFVKIGSEVSLLGIQYQIEYIYERVFHKLFFFKELLRLVDLQIQI